MAVRTLKPLSMGQILDRAFRVYRQQFLLLLGIVAAFQIPLAISQLIQSQITSQMFSPTGRNNIEAMAGLLTAGSMIGNAFTLLATVTTQFGYAALALIVAHSYLGKPLPFGDLVKQMTESMWQILLAIVLIMVLSLLLMAYAFLIPILGWFTGLGLVFYVSVVMAPLVTPVIALEKQGALAALSRTWALTRRRFWWVLGFGTILFFMAGMLAAGPTALAIGGVQLLAGDGGPPTIVMSLVTTFVTLAVSVVFVPVQIAAMTIMYLDLRVRFEGFDLALQSAGSGGPADPVTMVLQEVPAGPTQTQLITRNELLNFAAITILLWILIALFFGALFLLIFWIISQLGPLGGF
ncbi:MAG: hypothetical protein H6651_21550 [Ardenticatenales bacterium]|nr:hypothetical protein [Ardenticatenales bacterium]